MSRRSWLKNIAIVALSATLPAASESAAASTQPGERKKVSKTEVHYQNHPNAGKMCGMCRYFIPPGGMAGQGMMGGMMGPAAMMEGGTCQVVQGHIDPMGYCMLYTSV